MATDTRFGATGTARKVYDGVENARITGAIRSLDAVNTPVVPPLSMVSRAEIQALTKLKRQRVNYGVALGEASATARFLGDAATRVANGYRNLRRLDPKGAARALGFASKGDVPQRWLEYQYGLAPLLNDINGMVLDLQNRPRFDWRIRVNSRVKERSFGSVVSPSQYCYGDEEWQKDFEVGVVLYYEPQSYALASLANLGLTNPAEVAWELTPFSFVLDWFLPVGSWLSTLDASVGWDFSDGCVSKFCRLSTRWQPRPGNNEVWDGARPAGHREVVKFDRVVYNSSPIPVFPRPRLGQNLTRMANGLSLLATVFGGSSTRHR